MKRRSTLILCLTISVTYGDAVSRASNPETNAEEAVPYDLAVHTVDGVEIRGTLYNRSNDNILIYCHRLLAGKDGREVDRLKAAFLDEYDLLVYDSRGHKSSFGKSTGGGEEILDLHAILSFCKHRGYSKTVVLGAGMGGAVGARTARLFGNIDALIVISPSAFSPHVAPFLVRITSDKTFDTAFGKVPLRILADTRLGSRYSAGFPGDFSVSTTSVPTLIVHSEDDPLVNLKRIMTLFKDLNADGKFLTVPGRKHAEDLLNDTSLGMAKSFLETTFSREDTLAAYVDTPTCEADRPRDRPAIVDPTLVGDTPLPRYAILDELQDRLRATLRISRAQGNDDREVLRHLQNILFLRGYTRAVVASVDDDQLFRVRITCPRVNDVKIEGNRWLSEAYLRGVLRLGRDYFNAYELDTAIRRLASEPGIRSSRYSVSERPDGDLDIQIVIEEQRPVGLEVSSKFTDIDDFVGIGLNWRQFNPVALQYEGTVMLGVSKGGLLHTHCVRKSLLSQHLQLQAAYFDIVKSRDDLDYVFTRQEVHERGGDVICQYRISSEMFVRLSTFGKRYDSPEVTLDLPVTGGSIGGVTAKLDISGTLPLQREPRFRWGHTFYYQRAGLGKVGDFDFEIYQFNARARTHLTRNHEMTTTLHGGWVSEGAPPQEHLSIGGMTTLPGYPDDSFVNTRMTMASHVLCFSAASLFDETSVWSPFRLILSAHTGTVWAGDEEFALENLSSDVGVECDYEETIRVGVAWPVGNRNGHSKRFYLGWGTHVY